METNREKKYTYEDFLNIIATLRGENGCPWDREQTHMSLRPCMMEEAAEVMAAIRIYDQTGSCANLSEELGDVLLQVVMHAQIAKEEGLFTMDDVVNEVAEKMVRRHPHVFGTVQADTSSQVLENWEEIKMQEKAGKVDDTPQSTPLREIPLELPALTRAVKVLKKADKLYESQDSFAEALKKLRNAADELEALGPDRGEEDLSDPIGEMLLAVSNLSRLCKLSQEQILDDKINDIIEKFE